MFALRQVHTAGSLGLTVSRPLPRGELTLQEILRYGFPQRDLDPVVRAWRRGNVRHLWRGLKTLLAARALKIPHLYGQLSLVCWRGDGRVEALGLASFHVVTTAGVGYLVDSLQGLVEPENLKFHALGTGTNAEAVGDTSLQTELTTAYNPDNTRATGTTTENAANIYETVGTNTVDGAAAVTEHGILSQAAVGGGVLLDRSVFSVVNLAANDSLASTYRFTVTSGG